MTWECRGLEVKAGIESKRNIFLKGHPSKGWGVVWSELLSYGSECNAAETSAPSTYLRSNAEHRHAAIWTGVSWDSAPGTQARASVRMVDGVSWESRSSGKLMVMMQVKSGSLFSGPGLAQCGPWPGVDMAMTQLCHGSGWGQVWEPHLDGSSRGKQFNHRWRL